MDTEMVPDEQIAGAVFTRLTHDPRLKNKSEIKIDVEGGVVQIFGEVDDPLEKAIAGDLASTTPGVKEVVNSLATVINTPVLKDSEIASQVENAISKSANLTPKQVGAIVSDGIITLVGQVETEEQIQEAISIAGTVKGSKQVITNLRLIGEASVDEITVIDDALIRSLVSTALDDNNIELFDDKTTVANGRVFLRGNVNSEDEKLRAPDVVLAVRGVRSVKNDLVVWLSEKSNDPNEVLSAIVGHALGDNPDTSAAYIKVLCLDGVAHLFGQVDSIEQKTAAIETAQKVAGVRKVTDDITIMDRTTEPSHGKGSIRRRRSHK